MCNMELQNHTRTRSAHTRKKFAKTENKLILSLASETTPPYFFTYDHSHQARKRWGSPAIWKTIYFSISSAPRWYGYAANKLCSPEGRVIGKSNSRVKMPPKKKAGKGKKVKKGKKKKEGELMGVKNV